MPKTIITADSTCDIPPKLRERFGIQTLPLTITLGEDSFFDGEQFTPADMYRRYREDGTLPTTSAPSLQQHIDFFSALTRDGDEVVHLSISSELSASCNNARLAAESVPGVHVVDSRLLTTGISLLAIEGVEAGRRGLGAAEIAEHLRATIDRVQVSFVLNTLEYMRKGGRCSGITAFGANLLKIKPALMMRDGKLQIYKKYRGNIERVYLQYAADRLEDRPIGGAHVFITQSGEVPQETLDELESLVRRHNGACEIHYATAGCTISSHCGPKTFGLIYLGE